MTGRPTYRELEKRVKVLEREAAKRKQAEAALRENEYVFNEAQRIATTGSWQIDLAEGIQKISPTMMAIYGIDTATITMDQGWALVHPDDLEKTKAAAARAIATGSAPIEYRIVRPDGEVRTIFTPGALVARDEKGNPARLIGVSQDVTERKQAEEALRDSEQKYRTLFEEAAEGILIADIETKKFTYSNPAVRKMLGYTKEEIENMGIADIHPPDSLDHVISEFDAQVRKEKSLAPDIPCLRKDGTIIYADVNATSLVIEGRHCNVGFFTDTTERKLAEETARQHQAQIAHFARLRTLQEMTTELAHEIDQPLCAILTNTHACMRMIRSGSHPADEIIDAMEEVVSQVERANSVVMRVRGFARKREPQRESVDVHEIIRESLDMFRGETYGHGIKVKLDLCGGGPRTRQRLNVLADTILIETVLVSLVRNAIESMLAVDAGKRILTVRTECTDPGVVVVSVEDTGPGIREDILDKIFDPFVSTKPDGLGIGLSLGRSIVESHDGRLWAEQRPRGGAAFRFTLPVA